MTEAQSIARFEKIAICMTCGKLTREEAEKICDARPEEFGIRERVEKQDRLIV